MNYTFPKTLGGALLIAALLAGCARPTQKRLSGETYPRKAGDAPIELFIGKYNGPHEALAILNSISLPEKDNLAKNQQLQDLQRRARRLGADAIHDIRLLPREVRGYVLDESVPFRSWKQGVYYVYFLRGTAIRYQAETDSLFAFETEFELR